MLGYHIRGITNNLTELKKTFTEAIEYLSEYSQSPCFQIFLGNPRRYGQFLGDLGQNYLKSLTTRNIPIVIHGSYTDYPWKMNMGGIHNIREELKLAKKINAEGIIVHLGGEVKDVNVLKTAITKIGQNLALPRRNNDGNSRDTAKVTLWLEINPSRMSLPKMSPSSSSFSPSSSGINSGSPSPSLSSSKLHSETITANPENFGIWANLKRVFDNLPSLPNLNIGLCIDTAHLWSCGIRIVTYQEAEEWFSQIPVDLPVLLHLNDSISDFGSGRDQHAALCEGNIWRDYHPTHGNKPIKESGLIYILDWADSRNIITILERHPDYINHDLILIHKLGYFQ